MLANLFRNLGTPLRPRVPHLKHTASDATQTLPIPAVVVLPFSQHIGTPCVPVVAVGDQVRVGQVVADSDAMISAPIHASVSGTVSSISTHAITITTDGLQTLCETLKPPVINSRADFVAAVRASGLVGLGGAGFPAHVKLNIPDTVQIDTLLINGAECEPYITTDAREFVGAPMDILEGIDAVMQHTGAKQALIGIEDHNHLVLDFFGAFLSKHQSQYPHISIKKLSSTYPQGAEKVLIHSCTGRFVPVGKLPLDIGVIVMNVSSVAFLARYLKRGVPLIKRRVTVSGPSISQPTNVWAPIGTPMIDLIAFCDGYKDNPTLIIQGGPMMGIRQVDDMAPINKRTNALLVFDTNPVEEEAELNCIRCAGCVKACPVDLMPLSIDAAVRREDLAALRQLNLDACLDCGKCSFVCPSNRKLVQHIRIGKDMLRDHVTNLKEGVAS